MKWNKVAWVVSTVFFWGIGIQAVRAGDLFEAAPDDYIKTRTYAGGFGTSANIDNDGDFNNSLAFISTYTTGYSELDIVPSISRNFGFGGMVGYRTGAYAMEISFWASEHDSAWSDRFANPLAPVTFFGTSSYQSINIDFKRYLFTKFPTQPFFSLGLSFPWVVVRDGSNLNLGSGIVDDATISGLGFNLGAGLEIYISKDFSLVGGVVERFSGFNQINGAAKQPGNALTWTLNTDETGNIAGNGLNFYVGTTVGFE